MSASQTKYELQRYIEALPTSRNTPQVISRSGLLVNKECLGRLYWPLTRRTKGEYFRNSIIMNNLLNLAVITIQFILLGRPNVLVPLFWSRGTGDCCLPWTLYPAVNDFRGPRQPANNKATTFSSSLTRLEVYEPFLIYCCHLHHPKDERNPSRTDLDTVLIFPRTPPPVPLVHPQRTILTLTKGKKHNIKVHFYEQDSSNALSLLQPKKRG
jgi:hypothetical protein